MPRRAHQCVHWGTYIQAPRRERAIDVQVTTEFSVSGTQDFVARGLCRRLLGPHMLQTHVLVVLSLVDDAGHGIQTPGGCSCDGPPGPTATPATYSRPFTSTRDLGCNSLSGRRDSNEAGGWMGDVPIRIFFIFALTSTHGIPYYLGFVLIARARRLGMSTKTFAVLPRSQLVRYLLWYILRLFWQCTPPRFLGRKGLGRKGHSFLFYHRNRSHSFHSVPIRAVLRL